MRFVFVHKVVSVLFLFLRVRVRISDGNDGHQPCYGSDCDGDGSDNRQRQCERSAIDGDVDNAST